MIGAYYKLGKLQDEVRAADNIRNRANSKLKI